MSGGGMQGGECLSKLLLLSCLLGLANEFHFRHNYYVFFVLLHVRLTFLRCCEFVIPFYSPLLARRYRLGCVVFNVDAINVAIHEQVSCVCRMRFYQLFREFFPLKLYF